MAMQGFVGCAKWYAALVTLVHGGCGFNRAFVAAGSVLLVGRPAGGLHLAMAPAFTRIASNVSLAVH